MGAGRLLQVSVGAGGLHWPTPERGPEPEPPSQSPKQIPNPNPNLSQVPEGDWTCAACRGEARRRPSPLSRPPHSGPAFPFHPPLSTTTVLSFACLR